MNKKPFFLWILLLVLFILPFLSVRNSFSNEKITEYFTYRGDLVSYVELEDIASITMQPGAARVSFPSIEVVVVRILWKNGPKKGSEDSFVLLPDSSLMGTWKNTVDIRDLKRNGGYKGVDFENGNCKLIITPAGYSSAKKDIMAVWGRGAGSRRLELFEWVKFKFEGEKASEEDSEREEKYFTDPLTGRKVRVAPLLPE